MKKSLVALAALAVVGAASAQSTVTLSGVADVGLSQASGHSIAASANAAPAAAPTVAGAKLNAGGINNGNSRITFAGTEDLGGGLKASFVMEEGVNLATGATDAAGTFQRNAYLAVSGNFGEVYAGRRLSPEFYAVGTYELTGMANYSAVVTKFGTGGGTRNNAMAAYTTPNFGGFTATIGTQLPGNDLNGVGLGKTELNVIYKKGPLAAAFGYDKTDVVAGAVSNYNVTAGVSYDFGVAKVAVGYYDPAQAKVHAADDSYVKGYSLGASVPLGAATVTLDIARDTGSAVQSTDVVLEGKYALSKRTFVYGAVYRAGETVVGLGSATTTGVGIRHNF